MTRATYSAVGLDGRASAASEPHLELVADGERHLIPLRPGFRLRLLDSPVLSPRSLFALSLFVSSRMDGRPVACRGFLPGITLRVEALLSSHELSADQEKLGEEWNAIQAFLKRWIEITDRLPSASLPITSARASVGLDAETGFPVNAFRIEVAIRALQGLDSLRT